MAQSSNEEIKVVRQKITTNLSKAKYNKIQANLDEIFSNYVSIQENWEFASQEQKILFIENSPILKQILEWSKKWQL